jgi:hypothetical protein
MAPLTSGFLLGFEFRVPQECTIHGIRTGLTSLFVYPRSMIPVSGNTQTLSELACKMQKKSSYPAGEQQKSLQDRSSILAGKFSDFFRSFMVNSC